MKRSKNVWANRNTHFFRFGKGHTHCNNNNEHNNVLWCSLNVTFIVLLVTRRDATRRRDKCANQQVGEENHTWEEKEDRQEGSERVARGRIRRKETKRKQAAYIISIHTHWHFVPTDNNKNCIEPRGKQTIRYLYKCLSLHTHKHTHTYIGCSDVCVHISFSISLNERTNVIKTKTNEIWRK